MPPGAFAAATRERSLGSPAFRVANGVLGALFFLGAVVQWNDPDPLRWMAVYLAAASVCLLAAAGRATWPMAAAVALVALLWAGSLAPGVLGGVEIGDMVEAWEMKDDRIEEGREMYGLLLIGAWMTALAAVGLLRRRRSRREGERSETSAPCRTR
jgi:hypothetical protein